MTKKQGGLTLHEAMIEVLNKENRAMSPNDLALKVNYDKNDYSTITSNQIRARVRRYNHLFSYNNGLVGIRED